YDWLGNNVQTSDDAAGFYDRSLGQIENDPAKPYQLTAAEIPETQSARSGRLETRYDAAGHMTKLYLERDGPCLFAGGSAANACNQLFDYRWDEVGRLKRARRWDGSPALSAGPDGALPTTAPAADLRYGYDAGDQRVIKQAVD